MTKPLNTLWRFVDQLPFGMLGVACLFLGLAPFAPPHVVAKFQMLIAGTLSRPIDIIDFLFHGSPWVLLILKLVRTAKLR